MKSKSPQYYVGLMSGTSVDSIDAVLVDFGARHARCHLIATHQHAIPKSTRATVLKLSQDDQCSLRALGELDAHFGSLFAESTARLLEKAGIAADEIIAIGCHGQTLWHHPKRPHFFSMQIGDPNLIAQKTGIPTVADFRRADMAWGGQGAPLAPAFHQWLFQSSQADRAVINLGGIANVTFLNKDPLVPVFGFDTGPANALIDLWAQKHLNQPYDPQGQFAQQGTPEPSLLTAYLADPFFRKSPPKSTGKDYFNAQWVLKPLTGFPHCPAQDVQATLVELSAITIAQAVLEHYTQGEILLCGGGVHNGFLVDRLAHHLGNHFDLDNTIKAGLDPDWVEAVCFAWFARNRVQQTPSNLPSVTGAKKATILGGMFIP